MSRTTRHSLSRFRPAACAAALALAAIFPLASCSDSGTASGTAKMSILLTDAPGNVKQAVVTISKIYLQGSGGQVVLMDTAVTTDLLTLADSTASLVKDGIVPAGNYSELRFVVTGGYIAVDDGNGGTAIYASSPDYAGLPSGATVTGPLQMPSYAQSGLKVTLPGGSVSVSGDQKVLVVDFNVAQSFGQQAGGSGQWVMHPVLHATDFTTSASLAVTLNQDSSITMPTVNGTQVTLGDFKAVLVAGDGSADTLAFTPDSANAYHSVANYHFVTPASYTLDVIGPSGVSYTTDPTHPASVSLSSGQADSTTFKLTAVTAP